MPTSKNVKKIYRSTKDRWIAGVCAGFAEYFGADPSLIRLLWVVVTLLNPPLGLLVYIIAWIIIPPSPRGRA
jgi:phage shock protein C